jgi:hypothetical protein
MTHANDADSRVGIAPWQWRQIVNGTTDTAIITRWNVTGWGKSAANLLVGTSPRCSEDRCRIFAEGDQQTQLRREIEDAVSTGEEDGGCGRTAIQAAPPFRLAWSVIREELG